MRTQPDQGQDRQDHDHFIPGQRIDSVDVAGAGAQQVELVGREQADQLGSDICPGGISRTPAMLSPFPACPLPGWGRDRRRGRL